jgi:sortase A
VVRRAVRGTGKTLIAAGVLILLFVVYQLYGTGLAHDRHQRSLQAQFNRRLASEPTTTPTSVPASPTTTAEPAESVPKDCGNCVALISIPKIGLHEVVVEGVGVEELQEGVGHYPGTKMPGQPGNVAFAGHRTTYGHPFNRIDELEPGDPIMVTTLAGVTYRYEMMDQQKVTPDHVEVLDDTPDNRLTMTTCHPKLSAALRLIVTARLVSPPSPSTPSQVETAATTPPPRSLATEDRAGLSGATASRRPAIAWAILAICVWLAAWAVGRWSGRRWTAYAVATPLFLVILFMFFQNFARLLPANI